MTTQTQFDALAKKLQEYHDEASRIEEQLRSANLFLKELKQSAAKISSVDSTNLQSEAETIRLIQRINQTPFF